MHDVCIIGAGPVGATLALALADTDLDIALLDARRPGETLRGDRSLALSHGTRLILERLDAWCALCSVPGAVTPIREIDVSQARGFGAARLAASELELPALGYVVSYAALQRALDQALARQGIAVRFNAAVSDVGGNRDVATVEIAGDATAGVHARLAAVADGTGNIVFGMARARHDYGQAALVAKVWTDAPRNGVAYERFTAKGPIALLPEQDHYGLVWTMPPEEARRAIAMPDRDFLAALASHFGPRVRGFARVSDRRSFPLVLEVSRPVVATRVVVLGNAAQALHPVAGQGFNLGLRDAFDMARTIVASPKSAIGSPEMLERYASRRLSDRTAGIVFTHGLVQLFGTDLPFVRWPRGMALALLDALPPVKRAFTRAMLFGLR
jgi:2-octaprenyl-6-methoxyphenol hydroxylase